MKKIDKVTGNIWDFHKKGYYVILSMDAVKEKQKPKFANWTARQIRDNIRTISDDQLLKNWAIICKNNKVNGLPPVMISSKARVPTKYLNENKCSFDLMINSFEILKNTLKQMPNDKFVINYIGSNTGDLCIKDSRDLLEAYLEGFENILICDISSK
jgi:hypothetical protein